LSELFPFGFFKEKSKKRFIVLRTIPRYGFKLNLFLIVGDYFLLFLEKEAKSVNSAKRSQEGPLSSLAQEILPRRIVHRAYQKAQEFVLRKAP
jgi:hypothetical protein